MTNETMTDASRIDWLLDSDPSIRWQVLRPGLAGASEKKSPAKGRKGCNPRVEHETAAYQDSAGRWGGQLYNNKWLSTIYTSCCCAK